MLTFLPLEEIDKMDSWEGSQLNKAKEILAFELTSLVHGEEEAKKAEEAAKALFGGAGAAAAAPTTLLTAEDYTDGKVDILTLLVKTGLCPSKGDARRNVQQGGVTVNDEKVTDTYMAYTAEEIGTEGLLIKRGKKNFHRVTAE